MLTRFDPFFTDAFRLQRELMRNALPATSDAGERSFAPPVDVWEDDEEFLLSVELPGVKAENVEVEIDKNVLTLRGSRQAEKKEEKDGRFRTERFYGSFERSFTLPESVDDKAVVADMEDGVLKLRLPKKATLEPRKISIGAAATAPEQLHAA
mgnify:CR=1 FL=1